MLPCSLKVSWPNFAGRGSCCWKCLFHGGVYLIWSNITYHLHECQDVVSNIISHTVKGLTNFTMKIPAFASSQIFPNVSLFINKIPNNGNCIFKKYFNLERYLYFMGVCQDHFHRRTHLVRLYHLHSVDGKTSAYNQHTMCSCCCTNCTKMKQKKTFDSTTTANNTLSCKKCIILE